MRLYLSSYRLGQHPEELVRLAGQNARTLVIGNAQDGYPDVRAERMERETDAMRELGFNVKELDLREFFDGQKRHELQVTLNHANLLWVLGGNCFVLRRAFKQSGLDDILSDLLQRDQLVYAGYSAGIDQLVPSLHGAELVDDPHLVPPGYQPEIIWDAIGVLPYTVAPHYKSHHPESAAIDKSIKYLVNHHIPFVALRDGEEIIIDGEKQTVTSLAE